MGRRTSLAAAAASAFLALAAWTCSTAGGAPAPPRHACVAWIDSIDVGKLDAGDVDRPIRFSVQCPAGVAWRLVAVSQSGTCDGGFPVDLGGASARLELITPAGTPWCDGSNGTDAPSGIGDGAPQVFFARARLLGSRSTAVAAGRYTALLRFELEY